MKSKNKLQLLLILAGVLVGILLYFAPRQEGSAEDTMVSKVEETHDEHEGHDHSDLSEKELELSAQQTELIESLEKRAEQVSDLETKLVLYDSLIEYSLKNKFAPLVAKYTEEKAKLVATETNWMLAGDNYFKAFRLSKNQSKPMALKALSSYEEVLALNPENLDAQTAKGVVYVEASQALGEMPMKGIGILQEVLNKDPKNINALTNLGYFAIQSGQFEKAIERFETILLIDPENAEAYLYLTDIYLSQDDKKKGIETLEKYKSLVKDPLVKKQVKEIGNE